MGRLKRYTNHYVFLIQRYVLRGGNGREGEGVGHNSNDDINGDDLGVGLPEQQIPFRPRVAMCPGLIYCVTHDGSFVWKLYLDINVGGSRFRMLLTQ